MVLDTSALFAYLRREPEAEMIGRAIEDAAQRVISSVTVFEARTVIWGRHGLDLVRRFDLLLIDISADVHPFDDRQSVLAFAAYRRYGKGTGHPARLNLIDCAGYALATSLDMPLLFKGQDFPYTDVRSALV